MQKCYSSTEDHEFRISELYEDLVYYIKSNNDIQAMFVAQKLWHIAEHLTERHYPPSNK